MAQACVPVCCVTLGMLLLISGFLGCKMERRNRGSEAEEPAAGWRLGLLAESREKWGASPAVGSSPCLLTQPQESP